MGGERRELSFTEAVQVNPKVSLKKGREYPFVDMKAVDPSWQNASESEYRVFKSGGARFMPYDTLMARITPCLENGKIARFVPKVNNDGPAFGSTEFIVIRGRKGVTENKFAYYLTKWQEFRSFAVSQMTGSSGRQRVPADSLAGFSVPIPELKDQCAIAHILGSLDDKIELNRKMNETLEAMARAIFKSWFIDFDPVRAKAEGRDAGLPQEITDLFPDSFEDSELGEIPKGWEVVELEDVCKRITDGSHSSPKSQKSGYPMASVKDMHPWGLNIQSCRKISENDYHKLVHNDCKPLKNDVLIAKDGSYLKHIFVVNQDLEAVMLSSIAILRPNDRINPNILCLSLQEPSVMSRMKNYVSGAVLQRIVLKDFRKFKIVLSPVELQKAWFSITDVIFKQIWSDIEESSTLATLRDTLLPKLISGELRIPAVEKVSEEARS
jgi:type I restriction enzyme S subunit